MVPVFQQNIYVEKIRIKFLFFRDTHVKWPPWQGFFFILHWVLLKSSRFDHWLCWPPPLQILVSVYSMTLHKNLTNIIIYLCTIFAKSLSFHIICSSNGLSTKLRPPNCRSRNYTVQCWTLTDTVTLKLQVNGPCDSPFSERSLTIIGRLPLRKMNVHQWGFCFCCSYYNNKIKYLIQTMT